jgi:hypothetical protein
VCKEEERDKFVSWGDGLICYISSSIPLWDRLSVGQVVCETDLWGLGEGSAQTPLQWSPTVLNKIPKDLAE